jgi:hypothetical protein
LIDPHIPEATLTTTDRMLRQFAGLWILVLGGLAVWQGMVEGNRNAALVLAGLALVFGIGGLIRPPVIRPLFSTMMALTYPIGWVMSHLLLGLFFYGMVLPIGLFFRLIGRDALGRRKSSKKTYWQPKVMPTDPRSYFRQS